MRIHIPLIIACVLTLVSVGWWLLSRNDDSDTLPPTAVPSGSVFPVGAAAGDLGQQRERVRAAFATFLTAPTAVDAWTTFPAADGKALPLGSFTKALDSKIDPALDSLINQHNWRLYQCAEVGAADGAGINDIVLSMRFSLQEVYREDLYSNQLRGLLAWEQTLLNDVSPIVFPFDVYRSVPTVTGVFSTASEEPQVTLRVLPVQFAGGRQAELGYIFVGDELLVGSNRKCLLKAQELLFDTGA